MCCNAVLENCLCVNKRNKEVISNVVKRSTDFYHLGNFKPESLKCRSRLDQAMRCV